MLKRTGWILMPVFLTWLALPALAGEVEVTILKPKDGETVGRTIVLEYKLEKGGKADHVHWFLNGREMGAIKRSPKRISGLPPGRHTLKIQAATKSHDLLEAYDEVTIQVQ